MLRGINQIIVWFLLAAVPVQCYSAAGMLFCALEAQSSAHHSIDVHAKAEHHHHHEDSEHHPVSGVNQPGLGEDQISHEEHASPHGHGVEQKSSKCGVSAPCCVGGTLVSSSPILPLPLFANVVPEPRTAGSFITRTIDGLDRPPRSDLS
jgi:hypothetical protein